MAQEVAGIPISSMTFRPVEKSLKRLLPAPVGCQSPDGEPRATKQCKKPLLFFFYFASLDVYMAFVVLRKDGDWMERIL